MASDLLEAQRLLEGIRKMIALVVVIELTESCLCHKMKFVKRAAIAIVISFMVCCWQWSSVSVM